jgi:type 1 glutamine amidotransferase
MKNRIAQFVGLFTLIVVTVSAQQPAAPPAGAAPAGGGRGGGRGANANAAPAVANPNGVRIFIRAGLKSHAEGQHDYPQFLADWSKIFTERGARVDGGLHMPTAQQLAETDVVVFYKGDAGYLTDQEKADLDAFVKRGGGVVSLHDSLCGPDPVYFSTIFGGAKKHGEQNFSQGDMKYVITDKADPIMQGLSDFTLPKDEAFKLMTWAPTGLHVLATVAMPTGNPEVIPQIWTYEHTVAGGQPARSFVWMQGHTYANFADPVIKEMLLRGISWAAKKPVDTLAKAVARQGGRGVGGSDIVVPQ